MTTGQVDDLDLLIELLPEKIQEYLYNSKRLPDLYEIVLDAGRIPEVRFIDSVEKLAGFAEITIEQIDKVVEKAGAFNTDNRAGIERTLHRISAIRNRLGKIIGLTCRVGRAVFGTIEIVRDVIESHQNVLFLGPPGIGKTTILRETARVLSDGFNNRVVVVDTSNEIAGDGDIPHPGIGFARRMQVPSPDKQHAVMIEAVENHMPQVIIVDEIGTEEEAKAARTIAERGVQLVATAHGHSLENLIKNPTLADLLGGIQSVILGDEEAKYRGTQKTVLERKAPPTFDVLIEIRERDVFAIYKDVKKAVDNYLRQEPFSPAIRKREDNGEITVIPDKKQSNPDQQENVIFEYYEEDIPKKLIYIFPYGLNTDKIYSAIRNLQVSATIASNISEADLVLTVRSQVKSKSKISQILSGRQLPLHVLKRNSTAHIEKFLRQFFEVSDTDEDLENEAIIEIRDICKRVKSEGQAQETAPRSAYIRRLQHQEVEQQGLNSMGIGDEPNRRVRVYPT
jgi:stage III sporulation protein AA